MGYRCTNHPDTEAVLVITNLADGATINLCPDDIHPWAAAIAAATDPEAIAQAKADTEVAEPATEPLEAVALPPGDSVDVPHVGALEVPESEPGPEPEPTPEPAPAPLHSVSG